MSTSRNYHNAAKPDASAEVDSSSRPLADGKPPVVRAATAATPAADDGSLRRGYANPAPSLAASIPADRLAALRARHLSKKPAT